MTRAGRQVAQRMLAALIIVALLTLMGVPVAATIFFAVVIYFVWRGIQRLDQKEVNRIFEFCVAANDLLYDGERRWYGFEIAEVIDSGERVLHAMPDPPTLVYFALGALYHRAGKYHRAVEHFVYLVEEEAADERQVTQPSPMLRRYVHTLRRIERDPKIAPQVLTAVRSLERARGDTLAALLADSRARLKSAPTESASHTRVPSFKDEGNFQKPDFTFTSRDAASVSAVPRPIAEVLRDVYDRDYEN